MANLYRYKVYLTPLTSDSVYGSEIEITDRVLKVGVGSILRTIDSTDYGIGVYSFGDVDLTMDNRDGYFEDENDARSVFRFRRDQTKIRVEFVTNAVTFSGSIISQQTETIITSFLGLLQDDATASFDYGQSIRFKILSFDSILRRKKVWGGHVNDGMAVKDVFLRILNRPDITSVLTISSANINPAYNFIIDYAAALDNVPINEALGDLLLAANSILIINSSGTLFIKSRETVSGTGATFRGPYNPNSLANDPCNIIRVENWNNGMQRLFTSVKVNQIVRENRDFINTFGFRQKSIDLDFIISESVAGDIAANLLDTFKLLREEMTISIPIQQYPNVDLMAQARVEWEYQFIPSSPGGNLPVFGQTKFGDANYPFPFHRGPRIPLFYTFKIMEVEDIPNEMIRKIKIRRQGKDFGEGLLAPE